jgi:hypothetical protein
MSFVIPDHVLEEQIGDEIVLLSLKRETFFSLNSSGIELWARVKVGDDQAALGAYLCSEYGLPQTQASADVEAFLTELLKLELLERATESTG